MVHSESPWTTNHWVVTSSRPYHDSPSIQRPREPATLLEASGTLGANDVRFLHTRHACVRKSNTWWNMVKLPSLPSQAFTTNRNTMQTNVPWWCVKTEVTPQPHFTDFSYSIILRCSYTTKQKTKKMDHRTRLYKHESKIFKVFWILLVEIRIWRNQIFFRCCVGHTSGLRFKLLRNCSWLTRGCRGARILQCHRLFVTVVGWNHMESCCLMESCLFQPLKHVVLRKNGHFYHLCFCRSNAYL